MDCALLCLVLCKVGDNYNTVLSLGLQVRVLYLYSYDLKQCFETFFLA
jgi:hypothetical protein